MDRAGTVREFYTQIDKLERRIGGRWRLLHADARRPWPERGVFFLFERHERRTGSGVGSRVHRPQRDRVSRLGLACRAGMGWSNRCRT